MPCKAEKYNPNPTVTTKATWVSNQLPDIIAMCAQVIVAPEDKRMQVFSSGTSKGLIASIPTGGQTLPTSMLGLRDAWKNAQKKARKKKTSEQIKRIMPQRIPLSTLRVCLP